MRILTVAGLFLAFCALGLIAIAISTDNWYETDARRHRERCKNYSNKRNDPGYIYISNNNLPLRMMPKDKNAKSGGSGGSGEMLRAKRHFLPPASAMESHCSRQYNSTITGLWRKCHREGFDLETEDLIFKGLASGDHIVCCVVFFSVVVMGGMCVVVRSRRALLVQECAIQGSDTAHRPRRPTQRKRIHCNRRAVLFFPAQRGGHAVVTEASHDILLHGGVGGWVGGCWEGGWVLCFIFYFLGFFGGGQRRALRKSCSSDLGDILFVLFTSTGLVPRCTPIKYYYSSSALPRNLPINLTKTIRQDEWHALRESPDFILFIFSSQPHHHHPHPHFPPPPHPLTIW